MSYIVGLVYRDDERYFLAVDREVLLTAAGGRLVDLRPGRRLTIARDVSVGDLCHRWGVSIAAMDRRVEEFLAPSEDGRIRAASSMSVFLADWERKWAERRRTGARIADERAPSRRQRRRMGNVRRGRFLRHGHTVGTS